MGRLADHAARTRARRAHELGGRADGQHISTFRLPRRACADASHHRRQYLLPAGTSPCGLPGGQSSLVLAWDRSRVGDPAPDWSDFWDVARHPGKRSLRLDPRSTLEIALLADGVAPADVYSVLSTEAGVDRAFRKLDQLRPYIVWWRTPEDATRIMSSGAALMIGTPIDELAALPKPVNFAVQWRQSLRQNLSWAIPHNVPNPSAEHVAIVLRDQAPRHEDTQDGPLPDGSILTINDNFWATHLESLQKRFQDWFSPPHDCG